MSCTGVILAGGAASRFGGAPKGLERVDGRRIIDRVAAALREVTDELLLVANAPDAHEWLPGVRTVADLRPGLGALGGLHAALAHAERDILLVAWDMPFVSAALLGELRRIGEGGADESHHELTFIRDADVVIPESDGSRRGVEPLCAWYSRRCLPAVERTLDAGDLRVIGFHEQVRVQRLPVARVRDFGDPARLFSNVNTRAELAALGTRALPPMLGIVGRKHAGKTTLVVQLSAELARRGHRVMTLKHGSHTFNIDPSTTDTYRHYHEGGAERVAMVSPDKFALVERWAEERTPEQIVAAHLADADIVLCEGFKRHPMPKVEIHRREAHARALWPDEAGHPEAWKALVTDDAPAGFGGGVFALAQADWLTQLADWVEREVMR